MAYSFGIEVLAKYGRVGNPPSYSSDRHQPLHPFENGDTKTRDFSFISSHHHELPHGWYPGHSSEVFPAKDPRPRLVRTPRRHDRLTGPILMHGTLMHAVGPCPALFASQCAIPLEIHQPPVCYVTWYATRRPKVNTRPRLAR